MYSSGLLRLRYSLFTVRWKPGSKRQLKTLHGCPVSTVSICWIGVSWCILLYLQICTTTSCLTPSCAIPVNQVRWRNDLGLPTSELRLPAAQGIISGWGFNGDVLSYGSSLARSTWRHA